MPDAEREPTPSESTPRLQLLGAFVLAAGLAALGSGNVSLWTDEAITISAASRTWEQLWALLGGIDAVHGLYYALMKLWLEVFGLGEVTLRLPSAVAAGGTATGLLVLARRLTTPGTALTAALICAVLPRMTWAGIEARPFAFSALLAVWATWALVVALESEGSWRWARYAALAMLGVLSNIYLVMLVMGHGLTVLLRRTDRRSLWAYLAAAAGTALVTLPVLLLVRSQQDQLGTEAGADRTLGYIGRRIVINQVFLGETPSDGVLASWIETAWQGAAIGAALVGVALAVVAVALPARPGDRKSEVVLLTIPWILLPTLLVATYALLVAPIYQPRYFTFTVPAVALLLAVGVRALRARWLAASALTLLLVTVAVVYASQRLAFSKPFGDWAAASSAVASCASAGEAVLFEPRTGGESPTRTTRRIAYAYPQAFSGLEDLTLLESGAETGTLDGYSAALGTVDEKLNGYETVWVLYGVNDPEEVVSTDASVLMDAGFSKAGEWAGPSTTVVEYTASNSGSIVRPAECATRAVVPH